MHLRQLLMLSTIAAGLGGSGSSTSAITSLTVVGATPLLDQSSTTDFGDSTSRLGVDGNGWVAKVTVPLQGASAFDPTKISLTLSDPGYSAPSTTTTRTRTVRGGRVLRRQFTGGGAQANLMSSNDGTTLTIWFSLIGDNGEFATVYAGTTITAGAAASGFYSTSTAGAIASLTNSSTRAYPKAGWAWLNRQHEVVGAGGKAVELAVMHKHAAHGQQVAGVEFIATDAHSNTAATQTVSTPTLSAICTLGQPPEVFAATIPVTALTQADLCVVDAKIYPWLGDAPTIISTSGLNVTGTYATANPQTTLRFLNDKAGTFAVGHASVKAGAAGGTVQSTEVGSRATPFPDIPSALAALPAYNTAHGGHTGHDGGHIWLMDDGAGGTVDHHIAGADMRVAENRLALTEIRVSPSNTAAITVNYTTANSFVPWGLSWFVVMGNSGGHVISSGNDNDRVITYFSDAATFLFNHLDRQTVGLWNVTSGGGTTFDSSGTSTVVSQISSQVGVVYTVDVTEFSPTIRFACMIGCKVIGGSIEELDPALVPLHDSTDGKFILNNIFTTTNTTAAAHRVGDKFDFVRGLFIGQNVFEQGVASSQQLLSICDEFSDRAVDNIVLTANTLVGNRTNVLYTDSSTKIKRMASRFNLMDQRNTKIDLFITDTTATGRTGSWAYSNGVDNWDGALNGDSNGALSPSTGTWLGEYWANPAMADLTRAGVTFTADHSAQGSNVGNGTYSLTGSSNAAYNGVPSGFAPFKFDIAGVARKNDGTGAVGAYERTV